MVWLNEKYIETKDLKEKFENVSYELYHWYTCKGCELYDIITNTGRLSLLVNHRSMRDREAFYYVHSHATKYTP